MARAGTASSSGTPPMRFDRLAESMLVVTAFAVALLARTQSDTWWALRAGREIWDSGRVSTTESWSWTATGRDWPNHEWLWQVIAYGLHHLGGMPLLTAVNGLAAAGALVVARRARPADAGQGIAGVVVLGFAIPLISVSWSVRPQVASLLLFALLLWLLSRERWWWVPPVMLLWANLHGAVATGGVVLIIAAATALVSVRLAGDDQRVHAARRARTSLLVLVLSAAATLATPLGARLWTYVITSPRRSRSNGIVEWESAFHLSPVQEAFWVWLAGFVALVLWRRGRLVTWAGLFAVVVALTMAGMAVVAVRNTPFFVLATLPAAAVLLGQDREAASRRPVSTAPFGRSVITTWAILSGAVAVVFWSGAPGFLGWRPISESVRSAVASCPGRLYNTYDAGGPVLWFVPRVPVFVDSRQDPYPASVLRTARIVEGTGDPAGLAGYDIACALLPSDSAIERGFLRAGWTPRAQGSRWSILDAPQR